MTFRATEFEFRHRFWFICGLFCLGFACYQWDPENVSVALALRMVGHGRPQLDHCIRAVFGLGALMVTAAALVRSWAEAYLHSSVVHDSKLHSDRLVADGPFRRVRNPLYLGTNLLAIGLGLLASRLGFAVLAAGMPLFTLRLILREEAGLLASQGESYRRYFEAVPRLLPSLRPRVPVGAARPNWVDGFLGEIFMWGFAAGMAVFVATMKTLYFNVLVGAGFAVRVVRAARHARRQRRPA